MKTKTEPLGKECCLPYCEVRFREHFQPKKHWSLSGFDPTTPNRLLHSSPTLYQLNHRVFQFVERQTGKRKEAGTRVRVPVQTNVFRMKILSENDLIIWQTTSRIGLPTFSHLVKVIFSKLKTKPGSDVSFVV